MNQSVATKTIFGSELWWQDIRSQGTPIKKDLGNGYSEVAFYWRQPEHAAFKTVYIDCWSLTPHPVSELTEMIPVAGTDVWYWQVCIENTWQGSYFFVPIPPKAVPPREKSRRRPWWIEALSEYGQYDHSNSDAPYKLSDTRELSTLIVKPSVVQNSLLNPVLRCVSWYSKRLKNQRPVWLLQTGAGSKLPLVILLDGQVWANGLPIAGWLQNATDEKHLCPALYVFIDSLDGDTRFKELACNAEFWQAVIDELLPIVAEHHPVTRLASETLLVGQSLGGLAAFFASLFFPSRFGRALSQSGSFWWRGLGSQQRSLIEHVRQNKPCNQEFILQIGAYEDSMLEDNQAMAEALHTAGHLCRYEEFNGGHDWVCWREAMVLCLKRLLSSETLLSPQVPTASGE